MKKVEEIAINAIIEKFKFDNGNDIDSVISAKSAVETAKQNFNRVATPLVNSAKELSNLLKLDDVSEEAMKYFEERMSDTIKLPFKQ